MNYFLQGVGNLFKYSFSTPFLCPSLTHRGGRGATVQLTTQSSVPETCYDDYKSVKMCHKSGEMRDNCDPAGNQKRLPVKSGGLEINLHGHLLLAACYNNGGQLKK